MMQRHNCISETNPPLQTTQSLRCEFNIAQQGCVGRLGTQPVTCYCVTDLCNQYGNSTLVAGGPQSPG